MNDAEIAGYMNWRGPGAYTERQLQRIRLIVEEVTRRERNACAQVCSTLCAPCVLHLVRTFTCTLRTAAFECPPGSLVRTAPLKSASLYARYNGHMQPVRTIVRTRVDQPSCASLYAPLCAPLCVPLLRPCPARHIIMRSMAIAPV